LIFIAVYELHVDRFFAARPFVDAFLICHRRTFPYMRLIPVDQIGNVKEKAAVNEAEPLIAVKPRNFTDVL
jgi:hypothetical protein